MRAILAVLLVVGLATATATNPHPPPKKCSSVGGSCQKDCEKDCTKVGKDMSPKVFAWSGKQCHPSKEVVTCGDPSLKCCLIGPAIQAFVDEYNYKNGPVDCDGKVPAAHCPASPPPTQAPEKLAACESKDVEGVCLESCGDRECRAVATFGENGFKYGTGQCGFQANPGCDKGTFCCVSKTVAGPVNVKPPEVKDTEKDKKKYDSDSDSKHSDDSQHSDDDHYHHHHHDDRI